MAAVKLRQANKTGQEVGVEFVNNDQIVTVASGQNVAELQMADSMGKRYS